MDLARISVTTTTAPGVAVDVDIPGTWEVERRDCAPTLVAKLSAEEAGPFADNIVVTLEPLPSETPRDLEAITAISRAQQHASVPDLHLLEDRPAAVGGLRGHSRALLQTAPPGLTVITRQVFALAGDTLVTLALTSFPFRDRESSALMEQILDTLSIRLDVEDLA